MYQIGVKSIKYKKNVKIKSIKCTLFAMNEKQWHTKLKQGSSQKGALHKKFMYMLHYFRYLSNHPKNSRFHTIEF